MIVRSREHNSGRLLQKRILLLCLDLTSATKRNNAHPCFLTSAPWPTAIFMQLWRTQQERDSFFGETVGLIPKSVSWAVSSAYDKGSESSAALHKYTNECTLTNQCSILHLHAKTQMDTRTHIQHTFQQQLWDSHLSWSVLHQRHWQADFSTLAHRPNSFWGIFPPEDIYLCLQEKTS